MIEISNINPIRKNSVLATCTVYIKPWKMFMHEVVIFEKGASRWLGMPSRKYEKDGEIKYVELLTFDNEATKKSFRNQILEVVEKYLDTNPECSPENVIVESEFPF